MAIAPLVGILGSATIIASALAAAASLALRSYRISSKKVLTVHDIAKDVMLPKEVVLGWIKSGALPTFSERENDLEQYRVTQNDWLNFIKSYQCGEDVSGRQEDVALLLDDEEYFYSGYEEMAIFAKLDEPNRIRLALLDGLSQNAAKISLSLDRIKLLEESCSLLPEEDRLEIDKKSEELAECIEKIKERNEKIRQRLEEL